MIYTQGSSKMSAEPSCMEVDWVLVDHSDDDFVPGDSPRLTRQHALDDLSQYDFIAADELNEQHRGPSN